MKNLSFFFLSSLILLLSSCREDSSPEPLGPACPMIYAEPADDLPIFLPHLNIQPLFLEVRSGWESSQSYHSLFRASVVNNIVASELSINSQQTSYKSLRCKRSLSPGQYQEVIQWLNRSSVCKSAPYHSSSACDYSMIAPSSVYAVDPTLGPLTLGLTRYDTGNDKSFCNEYEVEDFYKLISSFYENLDYANECIEQQ